MQHELEIQTGIRFAFGKNWRKFLRNISTDKIESSKSALRESFDVESLNGLSFLDVGSGSGLSSLAAKELGAKVSSFDYDPESVSCTLHLRQAYCPKENDWHITEGSVLDKDFLRNLGQYDIVYSWGVLHHTGDMYGAFDNVTSNVKSNGKLLIAIYNDQGWISSYWKYLKKLYCRIPLLRPLIILWHLPYPFLASITYRIISRRFNLVRGMTFWTDYIDWLGGYPFEVATPTKIEEFFAKRSFKLIKTKLTKRSGCNEFLFQKIN